MYTWRVSHQGKSTTVQANTYEGACKKAAKQWKVKYVAYQTAGFKAFIAR